MYFEDLSLYEYHPRQAETLVLNVGWLGGRHPYDKGPVAEHLVDKLFRLCVEKPRSHSRGSYCCSFCKELDLGVVEKRGRQEVELGAAELWIPRDDEVFYASPDMIYHYVVAHGYRPPEEYLEALERYEI